MTVSRVVNGSGPVSEAVQGRVRAAIDELGYVPNRAARGLRSNRTHTLALIVTDVTNPFFTTVARGAEDAASDRDNLLLLCNTDESEEEELRYIEMLAGQGVDGVLFVPARSGEAARALAARRNLPMVVLDRRVPIMDVSVVRCDSKGGAADAARHLLALGHRRIALLAGPLGVPTSDDRVAGFVERLPGTGVDVTIIRSAFSAEGGRIAAEKALGLDPKPTAMFALNNFIAIGAMQVLSERAIRIPEDVSLVGFDDLPLSMVVQPFLTVVAQPAYEMGRRGVELMLSQLGEANAEPRDVVLPTELIVRKSTQSPL